MAQDMDSPSTSIGVWMEGDKNYFTYQLHTNIWVTGKPKERYLELGIKIPEVEGLRAINVFVPYLIEEEDFQELGEVLVNKPKYLSALFNKNVTVQNNHERPSNYALADVKGMGEIKICKVMNCLRSIEHIDEGSILKINFEACCHKEQERKGSFYFRFRLNNLKALHGQQNGTPYWFSGKKEIFTFLDFKLNYFRTLPDDIASHVTKDHLQEIHVFLLTCTDMSIDLTTKDPNDIRLIEDSLWSGYLSDTGQNRRCDSEIIAFHWMEKNEDEREILDPTKYRYELFAKLSTQKNNWKFIWVAIGVTVLVAILSSLVASTIYDKLHSSPNSEIIQKPKSVSKTEDVYKNVERQKVEIRVTHPEGLKEEVKSKAVSDVTKP